MCDFKLFLCIYIATLSLGLAQTAQGQEDADLSQDSILIDQDSGLKVDDRWFALDKGQHLVGSMILTIGSVSALNKYTDAGERNSKVYGAGFTFTIGLGKEFWDRTKKNNYFSYKDLCANVTGILLGLLILRID